MFRWYFLLFLCPSVAAQTAPSLRYVKFISGDDSLPMTNVSLSIDISKRIAFSNSQGVAAVDPAQWKNRDSVILSARSPGFLTIDFSGAVLRAGDTLVLFMPRAPHQLDAIELTRYEVPLIEPTLSGKRRGRKSEPAPVVVPDTIPAYTPHEISLYDSLTKGLYVIPDSVRATGTNGRNFFDYLKNNIRIPESSVTHKEEGTIYMQFEIDSNGYVQNIQCVHGNCPALAIAAAEVLARTPCIPLSEWEAPGTKRKTERFLLPVKLSVQ